MRRELERQMVEFKRCSERKRSAVSLAVSKCSIAGVLTASHLTGEQKSCQSRNRKIRLKDHAGLTELPEDVFFSESASRRRVRTGNGDSPIGSGYLVEMACCSGRSTWSIT
jgi:hypothetical protein